MVGGITGRFDKKDLIVGLGDKLDIQRLIQTDLRQINYLKSTQLKPAEQELCLTDPPIPNVVFYNSRLDSTSQ